jgi:alpha-beta hydrolase superfamily lysophospholipase
VATIILVRAIDSRSLPELRPWHRFRSTQEFRAVQLPVTDLAGYLAIEEKVFAELERDVIQGVDDGDSGGLNRFQKDSLADPARHDPRWNRTVVLDVAEPRAGALLVHGLTDSPYSLRKFALALHERGVHVVSLRLPFHGTAPGALRDMTVEDCLAAVEIGARGVRAAVGKGRPLLMVGYSYGGSLVVAHSLRSLAEGGPPRPDRVLLLSPAIGVTPFSRVGSWHRLLSFLPFFEKFEWMSIDPEYDPFKYVSFPKMAGYQMHRLTVSIRSELQRLHEEGGLDRMPRILTFQSIVDSTVLTEAVIQGLYNELPRNGSELVLYDVNRLAALSPFVQGKIADARETRVGESSRDFTVTLVTNASPRTSRVVARTTLSSETSREEKDLGLSWPPQIVSLSHVSLPFSPEDELYGLETATHTPPGYMLGSLFPRGKKGYLVVPAESFYRLRCNPFFEYQMEKSVRFLVEGE